MLAVNDDIVQKRCDVIWALPPSDRPNDALHVFSQAVQHLHQEAQNHMQIYFSNTELLTQTTGDDGRNQGTRQRAGEARMQAIMILQRAVDIGREMRTYCLDELNYRPSQDGILKENNSESSRKGSNTVQLRQPPLVAAHMLQLIRKTHVMLRELLAWGGDGGNITGHGNNNSGSGGVDVMRQDNLAAIRHAKEAYQLTRRLAFVVQCGKTSLPLEARTDEHAIRQLTEIEEECNILEFAKCEMQIAVLRRLVEQYEKAVKSHRAAIQMITSFSANIQNSASNNGKKAIEANQLLCVATYNLACDLEQIALSESNEEKKQALLQEVQMLFNRAKELGQKFLEVDHPLFCQLQEQKDNHTIPNQATSWENANALSRMSGQKLPHLPPLRHPHTVHTWSKLSPNNLESSQSMHSDLRQMSGLTKQMSGLTKQMSGLTKQMSFNALEGTFRKSSHSGLFSARLSQSSEGRRSVLDTKKKMPTTLMSLKATTPKKRKPKMAFDPAVLQCHRLRHPSDALRLGGVVVEDILFLRKNAEIEAEKKRQEEIKKQQRRQRRERSFLPESWDSNGNSSVGTSNKMKTKKKKKKKTSGNEKDERIIDENDIVARLRELLERGATLKNQHMKNEEGGKSHVNDGGANNIVTGKGKDNQQNHLEIENFLNALSTKPSLGAAELRDLGNLDLKALSSVISNAGEGELSHIAAPLLDLVQTKAPDSNNLDLNQIISVLRSKRKDKNLPLAASVNSLKQTDLAADGKGLSSSSLTPGHPLTIASSTSDGLGKVFGLKGHYAKETESEETEETEEEESQETEDDEQETKEEAKERCETELLKYFSVTFSRRMKAARRIQCAWRSNRARLALWKRQQVLYWGVYRKQKAAALCIEGFFSSVLERRRLQQKRELCGAAMQKREEWERKVIFSALIIAQHAVVFLRRRRQERELCKLFAARSIEDLKLRAVAATIVARWWRIIPAQKAYWRRRTREVEEQRQKEEIMRRQTHAATQIQRRVRGMFGRKEVLALRNRILEEHRTRQRLLHDSIDLVRLCLQEYTQRRKRLEREEAMRALRREEAAAVIQHGWKEALKRQMLHNTLLRCRRIVRAVLTIQRVYRRYCAGREIRYLRRMHLVMNQERLDKEYQLFRATMKLQCFGRMVIAKRVARHRRAAVGRGFFFAAVLIQSVCRGGTTRAQLGCTLHLQRMAAAQLLAHMQAQKERSAVVFGAFLRAHNSCLYAEIRRCRRLTEKLYIRRRVRRELFLDKSATVIQRAVRRWIKRRRYCEEKERERELRNLVLMSVVQIQSLMRGFLARRRYRLLRYLSQRQERKREEMEEVGLQMFIDEWRAAIMQSELERRRIETCEERGRERLTQSYRRVMFTVFQAAGEGEATDMNHPNDYDHTSEDDEESMELEKSLSTYRDDL